MNIAVITGASSGLGREFTYEVIKKYQLDEIWLIARRKERLKEIAKEYPNQKIRILMYDLTDESSFHDYNRILEQENPNIKLLVSNAGMGTCGSLDAVSLESQIKMMKLNVESSVAITKLSIPFMRKGSNIIQIASAGAFAPVKNMAIYSASKQFLIYFSKAIREELKDQGIHVCVVCPGNMKTETTELANTRAKDSAIDSLPFLDISKVVKGSLKAVEKGKAMYIPGTFYKGYYGISKLVPQSLIMKFNKA